MREDPHPLRDRRLRDVATALGVTRVARVTGLDRTGVEVASAVRPAGHVLQVTNGKGVTLDDAVRGALSEAAELGGAERADPGTRHYSQSARDLAADMRGEVMVLAPAALLGVGADPALDALPIGWCGAEGLLGARAAWVPEAAVHCPPPGAPLTGLAVVPWTSNGMGAHEDRDAALLHALLELVERDRLARALPEGFTPGEVARRLVDPATLARVAPETAAWVERLRGRGFGVHLLDVSEPESRSRAGRLDLPVAAALLVDPDGAAGAVPVSAGYACRLDRDAALLAALLEACQSRATEIHGAREDVLHGDRGSAAPLVDLCAGARPRRAAGALPSGDGTGAPAAGVRAVLDRLAAAGFDRVAAVDLAAPEGLHVVKVLVPGTLLSELL
jgi:ribosomal protein S12 methylthiotransferase accessory factor